MAAVRQTHIAGIVIMLAGVGSITGGFMALRGAQKREKAAEAADTSAAARAAATDAGKPETSSGETGMADAAFVLDGAVTRIDGTPDDLSAYRGKVVLVVNVASQCGLTGQYAGLQALYASKKDQGFVILGFPSNDFKGQEPGTNAEIAAFCDTSFGVTFPMFEKTPVLGAEAHPLYVKLSKVPAPAGGVPGWNFSKFLIDRQGRAVARFDHGVKPDAPELTERIDQLLSAPGQSS